MAILSIINADVVTQPKGSIIQVIAGSNEGKLAIATTSPNTDKIIGIRIEDDILITEKGPENISAGTPRKVADIEKMAKQKGAIN